MRNLVRDDERSGVFVRAPFQRVQPFSEPFARRDLEITRPHCDLCWYAWISAQLQRVSFEFAA
jgi:hypothetical protein